VTRDDRGGSPGADEESTRAREHGVSVLTTHRPTTETIMTDQRTPTGGADAIPRQRHAEQATPDVSPGWAGWVRFGGALMVISGAFAIIEGIVALAVPTTYVVAGGAVLGIGFPVWGWLHLLLGVLVAATGFGLLRSDVPGWARGTGVALVSINAIVQLAWLPAYPIWSIIVLTIDVFVLYALIVAVDDMRR
jgi:hypothetical protein